MTTKWFKLNVSCPAIGMLTSKFVKIHKYLVLDKVKDLKALKMLALHVFSLEVVRLVHP